MAKDKDKPEDVKPGQPTHAPTPVPVHPTHNPPYSGGVAERSPLPAGLKESPSDVHPTTPHKGDDWDRPPGFKGPRHAQGSGETAFKVADRVIYREESCCYVKGVKLPDEHNPTTRYSLETDDGKHSFDCCEEDLRHAQPHEGLQNHNDPTIVPTSGHTNPAHARYAHEPQLGETKPKADRDYFLSEGPEGHLGRGPERK